MSLISIADSGTMTAKRLPNRKAANSAVAAIGVKLGACEPSLPATQSAIKSNPRNAVFTFFKFVPSSACVSWLGLMEGIKLPEHMVAGSDFTDAKTFICEIVVHPEYPVTRVLATTFVLNIVNLVKKVGLCRSIRAGIVKLQAMRIFLSCAQDVKNRHSCIERKHELLFNSVIVIDAKFDCRCGLGMPGKRQRECNDAQCKDTEYGMCDISVPHNGDQPFSVPCVRAVAANSTLTTRLSQLKGGKMAIAQFY